MQGRAYKKPRDLTVYNRYLVYILSVFVLSGSNQRDGKGIWFGSIFWDVWRIHGFTCGQTLLATWLWFGFCVLIFSQSSQIFSHERNWHKMSQKLSNFVKGEFLKNEIDKNTNFA